jgi:hypothetical protein
MLVTAWEQDAIDIKLMLTQNSVGLGADSQDPKYAGVHPQT